MIALCRCDGSAELHEQILHLLDVDIRVGVGQRRRHQFEANPIKSTLCRRKLRHDVTTLSPLVHKALKAADLALQTGEPLDDIVGRFRGKLHGASIPLGVWVANADKCTYI